MSIKTRKASDSDANAICEVVRRSIAECCAADHRNDPLTLSAWLQNKTPENAAAWFQADRSIAEVAFKGDHLVGFALAAGNELALCYVLPEVLYQGVGKALLAAIESRAMLQGIRTLRLESTRTAQSFYTRNGYVASGPPQVWAGMEGLPMVKVLSANSLTSGTRDGDLQPGNLAIKTENATCRHPINPPQALKP
jgi:GNAT superfamily N-acetyltransferase